MSDKRNIDWLDELYDNGDLRRLTDEKILPKHLLIWRNIFHAYNQRLESTSSVMQSMEDVATNFNVSVDLVRMIRRKLS